MNAWKNVIVGVDGSEGSQRALAWAAEEARQHGSNLTVIIAWTQPAAPVGPGYASLPGYTEAGFGEVAEQLLTETITSVFGENADMAIERKVLEGHPAPILIEASADADVVVVGCRGHGAFAGMLLGSVSQHVAAHANCPVVVVR